MTSERDLRSALHEGDDSSTADGSWSDVTLRAAAISVRRARMRLLAGGAALVLVVGVLVVVLLPSGGTDRDNSVVTTPPAPGELLARVEQDGVAKLVVLSAADGHVVREISSDPSLSTFASVSAPATGETAYLTTSEPDPPTATCSSDVLRAPLVANVDLVTGALIPMARASSSPIVSPDGRWLAYLTGLSSCASPPPPSEFPTVGMIDLINGETSRPFEAQREYVRQPLAWSQDGARLLFAGYPVAGSPGLAVMDRGSLDRRVTELDQLPKDFESATFLPDGRLVVAYRVARAMYGEGVHHVAVVDDRGRPVEELFRVTDDGSLKICCGVGITADAAGRILLAYDDGAYRPRSGGVVQIWNPGDREPRTIVGSGTAAFDVQSVAWMPSMALPPSSSPGVSSAPSGDEPGVVVATSTQVGMLGPDDEIAQVLADRIVVEGGLAVTPDGSAVFAARAAPTRACPGPDIVRIPRDGGEPVVVASSATRPLVSPDGRWLAFAGYPGCDDAHASVGIVDLSTGEVAYPLEGSNDGTNATRPLAWAPGGALLYQASKLGALAGENPALSLLEWRDDTWIEAGTTALTVNDERTMINAAAYLPDGTVVVARAPSSSGPGMRVDVVDPRSGATARHLFDVRDAIIDGLTVDSTGTRVLVHRFDDGQLLLVDVTGDGNPRPSGPPVRAAAWLPGEGG